MVWVWVWRPKNVVDGGKRVAKKSFCWQAGARGRRSKSEYKVELASEKERSSGGNAEEEKPRPTRGRAYPMGHQGVATGPSAAPEGLALLVATVASSLFAATAWARVH